MYSYLYELFVKHPQKSGLTYFTHLKRAWSLSYEMAKGSIALLIHGIVPGLFETTGKETIQSLSLRI